MRLSTYPTFPSVHVAFAGPRPLAAERVDYDLVRTGEESWRLDLACPGFAEADLDIETQAGSLLVRGTPTARPSDEQVVHAGLARRPVERRFALGEHLRVTDAALADGILSITLVREVPEALRPRSIEIARAA